MKISTTKSNIISATFGAISLFVIWILISSLQENNFIFPTIDEIFYSLIQSISQSSFWLSFLFTLFRIIIVLCSSLTLSIILSFIYIWKKPAFSYFKPLLFLMKATPLAIISVYLWISLGSNYAPYLITFLMIFPVSIEGFITAIDQISNKYENLIKLEQKSLFTKYFRLYLPMIFPYVIMTILQTFGMSIKVMIMGEYICQTPSSLGRLIYDYKTSLSFSSLLGMMIIIIILISIIEFIIHLLSSKNQKNA